VPETDTQIWMALKTAVANAAGDLPVAWPAEAFTPPVTSLRLLPFIAVGDVQTATRAVIDRGAEPLRSGILSLAYVASLGYTHEWYIQQAAGLLGAFPVDGSQRYGSVCVRWGNGLAVPRVERGFQDGGYFRTPVLIPWRCSVA
jgi:hypothetical protein